MIEIEGFKIYEHNYKTRETKVVEEESGKEYVINFKELRGIIEAKDYATRDEFEMELVELLPKELPFEVRKCVVFNR